MLASNTWKRRQMSAICYVGGFGLLFLFYGTLSLIGNRITDIDTVYDDAELQVGLDLRQDYSIHHRSSRHLLFKLINCTPAAIDQFPSTYFTQTQRLNGAVILNIIGAVYMFIGLAIACDDYFVPSLESISSVLKLQPDVAGATFMAAGSSAPELATAVIGVFIAEDDIGLGAVVGSAVFNILFVISVCALFAGAVVSLNWWPLARDCTYYLISIIALALVILDETIYWYESLVFLILYAFYILIMYFNQTIETMMRTRFVCCPRHGPSCAEGDEHLPEKITKKGHIQLSAPEILSDESEESGLDEDRHSLLQSNGSYTQHLQRTPPDRRPVKRDEEEHKDDRLSLPAGCLKRIYWVLTLPLTIVMYITVPDTRIHKWKKWYAITFLLSCAWISLFSYFMVWMITIVGFTFNIPDTVMALTFIAAGVSVPDAIASLIVIKEGEGDMAVSNAIGSNVFDILVCLGIPWFVKTCLLQPGSVITVYSAGLLYATLTLFGTVILLVAATWINGWKLSKKYGVVLMFAYVGITILMTLYELNVFGYVHPASCQSVQ